MKFTYTELVDLYGSAENISNSYDKESTYDEAHFDSRKIKENAVFFAIDGKKTKAIGFLLDAFQAGAKAAVVPIRHRGAVSEMKLTNDHPIFFVDDSLLAFGQLGSFARDKYAKYSEHKGPIIGVIGSVGKTTTKNMLLEAGGGVGVVHASKASFNNQTGVPVTLCAIPQDSQRVIVELGESHFGDLDYITKLAKPNILVITNVALAHLEFLENLQGVAKTMNESVLLMEEDSCVVIPTDIAHKDLVLESCRSKVIEIINLHDNEQVNEEENEAHFYIKDVIQNDDLTHNIKVSFRGDEAECEIPLTGRHFVINAALALCASVLAGDALENAASNLRKIESAGHRMRIVKTDLFTLIDDCYNANPTSMNACIDALSAYGAQNNSRTIMIMGTMGELGNVSDQSHADVISQALDKKINLIICIGQTIERGMKLLNRDIDNLIYYQDVEDCIDSLDKILKKDDVIAVKASRGLNPTRPALYPVVESIEQMTFKED